MKNANRIEWTAEMVAAAKCGGARITPWAMPVDQVAELVDGAVTYRLPHADSNRVAVVTVIDDRAAVATNGNSVWGDYQAERGAVVVDDSDDVVLVHEATDAAVKRAAIECVDGWYETAPDMSRRPGETYGDWCSSVGGPGRGDWGFLVSAIHALTGREPTDNERATFQAEFLSNMWDRLPVRRAE